MIILSLKREDRKKRTLPIPIHTFVRYRYVYPEFKRDSPRLISNQLNFLSESESTYYVTLLCHT